MRLSRRFDRVIDHSVVEKRELGRVEGGVRETAIREKLVLVGER